MRINIHTSKTKTIKIINLKTKMIITIHSIIDIIEILMITDKIEMMINNKRNTMSPNLSKLIFNLICKISLIIKVALVIHLIKTKI
jgi:hypothetical protein